MKRFTVEHDRPRFRYLAFFLMFCMLDFGLYTLFPKYYSSLVGQYNNPLVIGSSVCLFLFFRDIHFYSPVINKIASTTLGIYAIHEYPYMRTVVWKNKVTEAGFMGVSLPQGYVAALGYCVMVFVVCCIIDLLRQKLFSEITSFYQKDKEKKANSLPAPKKTKLSWKIFSEYRTQIFGITILSIMIFHFFEHVMMYYPKGSFQTFSRLYIFVLGSIGVEIFLFLSGIGLYFSMSRNSHVGQFYRKRLQRVLIPYLIWGLVYWGWTDFIIRHQSAGVFWLDYTTISLWTQGKKAMWYVNFILVMYLAFPAIYRLLRKENRYRGVLTAALACGSLTLTILMKSALPKVYNNIEIELYRIPIFFIGVYYGKACAEGKKISKSDIALIAFGILVKLGYALGKNNLLPYLGTLSTRVPQILYCIAIMFLFAVLAKALSRTRSNAFLLFCGTYSFELYITHVALRGIMNSYGMASYRVSNYLSCMIAAVLCSVALKQITDWILKLPATVKRLKAS